MSGVHPDLTLALEFEKRAGGAGPVGQTISLGTIGDINVCKLS